MMTRRGFIGTALATPVLLGGAARSVDASGLPAGHINVAYQQRLRSMAARFVVAGRGRPRLHWRHHEHAVSCVAGRPGRASFRAARPWRGDAA